VHTDTGIDKVGASVVSVALQHADAALNGLDGRNVLIVGAGSMAALAASTVQRRGARSIVVSNRSDGNGSRLAASVGGRFVSLDGLADEIAAADLLISATGSVSPMIGAELIRARGDRPLAVLDLALPRDIAPEVALIPGVYYTDLDSLRADNALVSEADIAAARAIIAEELVAYLAEQQRLAVAPTVTALRARANQVIETELSRLDARLPGLDASVRKEVAGAVRRAVEKVLHAPTVRVKELATTPEGDSYAKAMRVLFDLDPAAPESVAQPGSQKPTTASAGPAGLIS
jgi:glutamyl-tRNA reductase